MAGTRAIAIALLLAAGAQAGPKRLAGNMAAAPIGTPADWISPDDYPADAVRSARQGRVIVAIGIDSTGKVVSCAVEQSSGTQSLDARTCELAMQRGTFNPATDRKGLPIASTYSLPVRWVLPEDGEPAGLDAATAGDYAGDVALEIKVDPEGKLAGCRIVSGHAAKAGPADPCAAHKLGETVSQPWHRNGHAVGATILVRTTQTVTVDP